MASAAYTDGVRCLASGSWPLEGPKGPPPAQEVAPSPAPKIPLTQRDKRCLITCPGGKNKTKNNNVSLQRRGNSFTAIGPKTSS